MKAFTLVAVLCSLSASADVSTKAASWLSLEQPLAVQKLLANINPAGTSPGVVVASPSRRDPDYFFHWIRDAALTMDTVATLFEKGGSDQDRYRQLLEDYVSFSSLNQQANTQTGLGEPKFYVDGAPYNDHWGRPQNDGPALRAATLTHFAWALMKQGTGDDAYIRSTIYAIVKPDLEYVSHHWWDASYDIWEEVKGDHFYTRMVQRKALIRGAELAELLSDPFAAKYYREQAGHIEESLNAFWNESTGRIVPTLHLVDGVKYKSSDLDSAVILGVLHGDAGDGFMSLKDPRVQATLTKISQAFAQLYNVNRTSRSPGVLIGRYPEDRYAGTNFDGGNPWVLATLAFAEANYRVGKRAEGDQYVAHLRDFLPADGALAEQIDRNTGKMTSARDLTWNYAAVLTALWAR